MITSLPTVQRTLKATPPPPLLLTLHPLGCCAPTQTESPLAANEKAVAATASKAVAAKAGEKAAAKKEDKEAKVDQFIKPEEVRKTAAFFFVRRRGWAGGGGEGGRGGGEGGCFVVSIASTSV